MNHNQFSIIDDDYYYDKSKLIGYGSNGVVYECYSNRQPHKRLCVKIYRLCNDDILNNLKNEVQIAKQLDKLSKDNIVEIFLGIHNPKTKEYLFVMERCDKDLKKFMLEKNQKQENFKPTEIISFIQQFVNGYKNLFEQQIIHRDIKPANILLNQQDSNIQYKIADLGSSKIYTELHNSCNQNYGSALFAAPEILKGNQTNKSDVFSFGCTLYQLMYFNDFKLIKDKANKKEIIINYQENNIKFFDDPQFNLVLDLLRRCLIRDQDQRISWEEIFQHPVMEQGIITKIKLVEDSLFLQITNVIQTQTFSRPLRWNNKPRDKRIHRFLSLLKVKQMFILKLIEDLKQYVNSVYSQFFSTGLNALVALYYRYEYGFISNEQKFIPLSKRKYFIVNHQESNFTLYFMLHIEKQLQTLDAGKKKHQERIKYLSQKIENVRSVQIADYLSVSHQLLLQIQDETFTIFMQENLSKIKEFSFDLDIEDIIAFMKRIYLEKLQFEIEHKQQDNPNNQQIYQLVIKEINTVLHDLETKYEQMKYNLINIPTKLIQTTQYEKKFKLRAVPQLEINDEHVLQRYQQIIGKDGYFSLCTFKSNSQLQFAPKYKIFNKLQKKTNLTDYSIYDALFKCFYSYDLQKSTFTFYQLICLSDFKQFKDKAPKKQPRTINITYTRKHFVDTTKNQILHLLMLHMEKNFLIFKGRQKNHKKVYLFQKIEHVFLISRLLIRFSQILPQMQDEGLIYSCKQIQTKPKNFHQIWIKRSLLLKQFLILETKYEQMKFNFVNIPSNVGQLINNY
ncbi:hypothetical protein pb186bvf_011938 [Paramecium bursaria]